MKYIKKLILFTVLFAILLSPNYVSSQAYFRIVDETKTTTYVDGIRHQELIGTINYNGTESLQKVNYLGADPSKEGIAIVTADNYLPYGWGKGTLENLKDNIHNTYDNYEVVGGVNGDFFGASGIPIEAFIRDYNVISAGLGNERTVIGFKDNGDVVFTRPEFDGYEINVYNEDDELKKSVKVDYINQHMVNGSDVYVYFDNYNEHIANSADKIILSGIEIHKDDWGNTYYGKGKLQSEQKDSVDIEGMQIIINSRDFNKDDLITETDYVVVQKRLVGDWEDVRFAISGWEILVTDGDATEEFFEGAGPSYRHPRTAVGIKEDGTVFFVVVDGRDYENGFKGITEYELSELMLHYGAVDAFNLDGGGSSAMLLKNESGEYEYVNTPSDGTPRPVTNGVFFVLGTHKERVDAIWPDNREILDTPENIHISREGLIEFEQVVNATHYEIIINEESIITDQPSYQLTDMIGTSEITVKAIDETREYKNSLYTESITHYVYTEDMQSVINYFMNYTRDETED